MTLASLSPVSPDRPPLDPSALNARTQLIHELAKSQYQTPKSTWVQSFVQGLENWFNSLFSGVRVNSPGGSAPSLIGIVIVVLIVAAVVVGFLVFGVPRINRRSAISGALFGENDDRDSDALRRAAEQAAASGDFATAIEEGFRAIARGLAERVVVTTFPGTTAHTFAAEATRVFPGFGAELARAADAFDAVRYLGERGTEADWLAIAALESGLRRARPLLDAVTA
jgi:hypothetical protein